MFDEPDWSIRYVVIDTRNWLRGRHVVIEPGWIDRSDWAGNVARIRVSRAAVERSPKYDPATLSGDYPRRLRQHYLRHSQTVDD